jgi:hypothetical protein
VLCPPPFQPVQVYNDGTNIKFMNFIGPVGTYYDYCGSSMPNWNAGCTIPPLVNCDGTAISSIYTVLPIILGSSLLPNSKGRARFALDQGAGNISSAVFSGTGVGATGGNQTTTLSSLHLPKLVDGGHIHGSGTGSLSNNGNATGYPQTGADIVHGASFGNTASATTGITYGSSSQISVTTTPPAFISGLMLIRAG